VGVPTQGGLIMHIHGLVIYGIVANFGVCQRFLHFLVGVAPTPKIHRLMMVGHHAKFNSFSKNGWSVEITGMKKLGLCGSTP